MTSMLLVLLFAHQPHADVAVSAELVCNVKAAIGRKRQAWDFGTCRRVARATNKTPQPVTTLATGILESDLQENVATEDAKHPGTFDVGIMAVRCVTSAAGKPARANGARSAGAPIAKRKIAVPAGRCQNGPARGLSVRQLKDPGTNIRIAAQIMAEKQARFGADWARHYNGSTTERGYAEKVLVIEAALRGVELPTEFVRVRELAKRIMRAVNNERES